MKVYNVLHRKKEEFIPQQPNRVKMYVCGMTVNGEPHLGHARQVITFDMISQYLRFKGYEVIYVSNYTDVDDRIINQAKELNISPLKLANQRIQTIEKVWSQICVSQPNVKPRVTYFIPQIIDFVKDLINKGYAYTTDNGDVYFSVKKYSNYGVLSNRKIDELINSVRIETAENKRDALDFALWKSVDNNEFGFESPWGKGRPGWHIECSTMIKHILGNTVDIHGGGKDLIFPHHENELAQSSCENGCPLANYWLHNGLITVDGQKMSKSFGNFVLVKDVLKNYDPEVLRLAVLINHYTSTLDMGENSFKQAEKNLYYFYNALNKIELAKQSSQVKDYDESVLNLFIDCMDDDFNSAKFIAELFSLFSKSSTYNDNKQVNSILFALDKIKDVLGIFKHNIQEFIEQTKQKYLKELNLEEEYINKKIQERTILKQQKNYVEADKIRDELDALGIILKDNKQTTTWDIKKLY